MVVVADVQMDIAENLLCDGLDRGRWSHSVIVANIKPGWDRYCPAGIICKFREVEGRGQEDKTSYLLRIHYGIDRGH